MRHYLFCTKSNLLLGPITIHDYLWKIKSPEWKLAPIWAKACEITDPRIAQSSRHLLPAVWRAGCCGLSHLEAVTSPKPKVIKIAVNLNFCTTCFEYSDHMLDI
jgi:hypothetical protein